MDEKQLHTEYQKTVLSHFRNIFTEKRLRTVDGYELRYIMQTHSIKENGLVVIGGRTEFIEKYAELFFDIKDLDVTIYSYDHRGQGYSTRLHDDLHKSHVHQFSNYADDLRQLMKEVVLPRRHRKVFILSFSMGSTVTVLYQLQYPGNIDAAILCCPMLAINTLPLPLSLVSFVTRRAVQLGYGKIYIPGGRSYNYKASFYYNPYTSSKSRFQLNRKLVESSPALALGSPTVQWLSEAIHASQLIMESAQEISIPLLMLQSGRDRVVRRAAQQLFCRKAEKCELFRVKNAKHELLMERDVIRNLALEKIKDFLQSAIIKGSPNQPSLKG